MVDPIAGLSQSLTILINEVGKHYYLLILKVKEVSTVILKVLFEVGIASFAFRSNLVIEVAISIGECLCPLVALGIFVALKVIDEVLLVTILIPESLPCMLK